MKRTRRDDGSEKPSAALNLSTAKELISREVKSALEQSDKMMKALMDRIQEVDNEPRYDVRIRKLEAHVRKVKRRGDTVFANIQKRASLEAAQEQVQENGVHEMNLPPTLVIKKEAKILNVTSSANGGVSDFSVSGAITSEGDTAGKPKEDCWQSLRIKNQFVDLTVDGEVCRKNGIKHSDSPQTSSQEYVDSRSSPLEDGEIQGSVVVEKKSPEVQEAEAALLSRLPPFPHTPFPNQLPVAAASRSMPQKPVVKVARIKTPRGIALLWNVEEEDPDAATMDCYYIYVTQERSDGTFTKWKTMGVIKAMPLPMACRVAAERSGDKTLCFIIIGKDVYGRYGPYSDVHTVWPGET
ncbi:activating transcription factor 7-interacting protein 2 isoform X1 [Ictalurus punctatus]|uniref:Activating transcription factor 7-interacting protein 2 isoform X1 n=1 Tax=Ictalurus punctatus TaxID=7998 RepID=A0A2D0SP13_ICTPU|nr:activating transcription factor 7-interacting protein 2 isoform X1 [Ictalurus punctatus]